MLAGLYKGVDSQAPWRPALMLAAADAIISLRDLVGLSRVY
jgi:hypothetical protein